MWVCRKAQNKCDAGRFHWPQQPAAKQAFTASRKSTGITFCPWNSWNKIAPFRMHGCSISTILLPFKILYPIWAHKYRQCPPPTPPFSPWHKAISTMSYRPWLVPNLSRRQTYAPAKAIKSIDSLSLWEGGVGDGRWGGINTNTGEKFIKEMQWDSKTKEAESHTDVLFRSLQCFLENTLSFLP